jgi:type I restriction-modification system DNA methylase subunit
MGSKGMNKELSAFVKKNYPDSKADLFACFMERCLEFTVDDGLMAMINQHSWMFLSSYEKLRIKLLENHKIDTLVHLGPRAFEEIGGEVVQSVAFVLQKGNNGRDK